MTSREAQRELERAGAALEIAIQQLVATPTEVDCWAVTLQAVDAALQKTREQLASQRLNNSLRTSVQRIHTQVKQVDQLLQSAALFYCGCVALVAPQSAGYTHAGISERVSAGGRMQLEA